MTGSRPQVKPVAKPAATVGDKKARKYILNQIKNKTTVPDFKLNTEIPKVYKPEPPTPEELAAEKKFKKLLDEVEREKEINKRSGIRGLLNEY